MGRNYELQTKFEFKIYFFLCVFLMHYIHFNYFKVVTAMRVASRMTGRMGKESTPGKMEGSIQANSVKDSFLALELLHTQMVKLYKESGMSMNKLARRL